MSASVRLVHSLRTRGVKLWARGGQLHWRAPEGLITSDEIGALRTYKLEIVARLEDSQRVADIPLTPGNHNEPAPLTPLQLMPYFSAAEVRRRPRTMPVALLITGSLEIDALRESIYQLQLRHDSLRTNFVCVDGELRQCVASRPRTAKVLDAETTGAGDVETAARQIVQDFCGVECDLAVDAILDSTIVRMSETRHAVVISVDHIVTDALSNRRIIEEVFKYYSHMMNGGCDGLQRSEVQFGDYACWLTAIRSCWIKNHRSFWMEQLADATPTKWPVSNASNDGAEPGNEHAFTIEGDLAIALLRLARRERVLPAMVMLTAFCVSVLRWCNQKDIVIALVDTGRYRSELVPMIGLLAGHLHLRVRLRGNPTFNELLQTVVGEVQLAYQHRDFDMVPTLMPTVVSEVTFNWLSIDQLGEQKDTAEMDLKIEQLPVTFAPGATAKIADMIPFKLGIFCNAREDSIKTFIWGKGPFQASEVDRFGKAFRSVLDTVLRYPSIRLDDI